MKINWDALHLAKIFGWKFQKPFVSNGKAYLPMIAQEDNKMKMVIF